MATSVKVTWHTGTVNTMLHSKGGDVGSDVARRGQLVLQAARQNAPSKTGKLRGSIKLTDTSVMGNPAVTIGSDVPYAIFVHEGTRPHTIRAGKRVLAFPGGRGGGMVFAKSVNHPGTAARPFLARALEAAR